MKKVLKIIGIILFVFILIGAALFIYLSKRPAVSDDYIRKVQADQYQAIKEPRVNHAGKRGEQAHIHET